MADAVRGDDRHGVGYGVALHGALPRHGGVQCGVMRFRADGGRIHQDVGALQGHGAGGLGIPLVPADADADAAEAGAPDLEAGVAGTEVVLLLIAGAVRDMALAIDAQSLAVGVEHDHRVEVVRPLLLEDRDGDDDAQFFRHRLQLDHGRMLTPRIGGREPVLLLRHAEVGPLEQLGRQDDLRTLGRRLTDQADGLVDIGLHVLAVRGLQRGDGDGAGHLYAGSCWLMQWKEPPPVRTAFDGDRTISRSGKTVARASPARRAATSSP